MTIKEQMTAGTQFMELWQTLMPHSAVPGPEQFLLWAGMYPENLVAKGINRAAGKTRKMRDTETPMSLDDSVRYASSVMKNESLGIRRSTTAPMN